MNIFEKIWHQTLKFPYKLKVYEDSGNGTPIVFLHGLGAKAADWEPVIQQLDKDKYRLISLDLLGFGESPKPEWKDYSAEDHAASVHATLKRLRLGEKAIVVGHSLGAVVAARLAKRNPEVVSRLVLYEIPVYTDSPDGNGRDIRNRAYVSFFTFVLNNPKLTMRTLRFLGRVAADYISMSVDKDSWISFERSLINTVMEDSVYEDLADISLPVDIVYGRYDIVVVKRSIKKLFKSYDNISFTEVAEAHRITARTGKVLRDLLSKNTKDQAVE